MVDFEETEEYSGLATSHIAGYSFDGKLAAVKMMYAAACEFFGQAPKWTPGKSLPKPPIERIVVSDTGDSPEETLRKIINQCYAIECDDRLLRDITTIPGDGVRSYFANLRAEYGVRREFYNTTIELPAALASMEVVVKSLGFSVVNR
jgi:erythronate-4-phosphate dehydrogenase